MLKLNADSYEHIKTTIVDMFEYYDIKSIPISPIEIASKIGLSVIPYSSFGSKSKILIKCSEVGFLVGNKICYNDKCQIPGRIKQTLMHEIGHFVLGHCSNGPEEEAEANFFAKYALAPPPLIHRKLPNPTVENIVDCFEISFTAAQNALNYYYKWRYCVGIDYTDYEQKLFILFADRSGQQCKNYD